MNYDGPVLNFDSEIVNKWVNYNLSIVHGLKYNTA
jgi:hypothetical protein